MSNYIELFYNYVITYPCHQYSQWWLSSWLRHRMETFSALLAICAGNSPVPGEFPAQRPVMQDFAVFFDLRLNKRLSKQSWGWWFEMLPRPLWRHSSVNFLIKGASANVATVMIIWMRLPIVLTNWNLKNVCHSKKYQPYLITLII